MKVVILAGGLGTRISEESHLRPKPMIEIGGVPILWHIMKIYSHYGFNEFVICCGYKGHMIKEYFADYYLYQSDITFDFSADNKIVVHNNVAEPWKVTLVDTGLKSQTGRRVKCIEPYVNGERFMLTYGDGVSDVDLNALLRRHKQSGKTVTLTAIRPGGRYGVLDIEGDAVTAFNEKAIEHGGWINAGFMVAETALFDYIEDGNTTLERAPMERLSTEGKLGVYKHYGYWQCMDTARDKDALEEAWASNEAKWKVWG